MAFRTDYKILDYFENKTILHSWTFIMGFETMFNSAPNGGPKGKYIELIERIKFIKPWHVKSINVPSFNAGNDTVHKFGNVRSSTFKYDNTESLKFQVVMEEDVWGNVHKLITILRQCAMNSDGTYNNFYYTNPLRISYSLFSGNIESIGLKDLDPAYSYQFMNCALTSVPGFSSDYNNETLTSQTLNFTATKIEKFVHSASEGVPDNIRLLS